MKQPQTLEMVAEFHRTFQHPILQSPSIPDAKRAKLRVDLIAEELREFEEAIQSGDIVGVADALCDIQYVLSGAVLEFGLADKFQELFNEVQRSNMSKACNSEAEAIQTVEYYQKEKGVTCYYEQVADKWLVYRKEDNKTIKSVGYSPADLKSILEKG